MLTYHYLTKNEEELSRGSKNEEELSRGPKMRKSLAGAPRMRKSLAGAPKFIVVVITIAVQTCSIRFA